jgi:non-specific serine/threonine protein kinase
MHGYVIELSERVDKLLTRNTEVAHRNPQIWGDLLNISAWLAYVRGDEAMLALRAETALHFCQGINDARGVLWALRSLGQSAALRGDTAMAIQLFTEGLAGAHELGDAWFVGFFLNNLGIVNRNSGDYIRSLAYHTEAAQLVTMLDDRSQKLKIFWEAGTSLLFQQEYTKARQHYIDSLSYSHDPIEIAYSLEGFAGLAAAQQQPERAARLLGAADAEREAAHAPHVGMDHYYERFIAVTRRQLSDTAFDTAWAGGRAMTRREAIDYALQADAAPTTQHSTTSALLQPLLDPLSPRELEVLRLIGNGFSNAEIAAELVLAVGTVKAHLRSIFGKLGVTNRTQAVLQAQDHKLI